MAIWTISDAGDGNQNVIWQEDWDRTEGEGFSFLGMTADQVVSAMKSKRIKKVNCTPNPEPRAGVQVYVYSTAVPGDLIIDGKHIGYLLQGPPGLS